MDTSFSRLTMASLSADALAAAMRCAATADNEDDRVRHTREAIAVYARFSERMFGHTPQLGPISRLERKLERVETVSELRTALHMPRPEDFVDVPGELADLSRQARIVWQNRQTRWDVAYATLSRWERFKYRWLGASGIGLPVGDL